MKLTGESASSVSFCSAVAQHGEEDEQHVGDAHKVQVKVKPLYNVVINRIHLDRIYIVEYRLNDKTRLYSDFKMLPLADNDISEKTVREGKRQIKRDFTR